MESARSLRIYSSTHSSVSICVAVFLTISSYIFLPEQLSVQAWMLSLIFLLTLYLAVSKHFETGVVALISISLSLVTQTLTIEQALSKFNHPVSWLILTAFFISRGIVSSGLAKRIAYTLAYLIGSTPLRLSYALMAAETLLAPFIPSNTARGAGLIFPVAQSLCQEIYSKEEQQDSANHPSTPSAFLLYNCFQANIISSALFLTAAAGNPIIASLSSSYGFEISWFKWFISALVPALCCLITIPFVQSFLLTDRSFLNTSFDNSVIIDRYKQLGPMASREMLMLITFFALLFSWIFAHHILHPTASALIAVTFLLLNKVISWDDVIQDKAAWTTFIWLTTLLMLSSNLKELGVIDYMALSLTSKIPHMSTPIVLLCIILLNFFSHYLFASMTSHATTLLPTFITIGLALQVPIAPLVLSLAFSTSLSAGLTHYGTGSAPIFYNAGYWSLRQWWMLGLVHSLFALSLFILLGMPFWWVMS